ncbi:hypothetical protein GCM10029963_62990 [Micromonospora andamanensis]
MITLEPIARPDAPLARRNPVAKLTAAMLFTFPLMATLDPVTPAIAIAVELAVLPLFGVHPGCWPDGSGHCLPPAAASWSRSCSSPPTGRAACCSTRDR